MVRKNEKFGDVRWFNEFLVFDASLASSCQKTQAFALGATHFTLRCPVPKTFFSFIIHFTSRILGECFVSGDDEMEWNAMLGMLIIIKKTARKKPQKQEAIKETHARDGNMRIKRRLWCIYGTTQLFDDDDEELCLMCGWSNGRRERRKSETRVDVCLGPAVAGNRRSYGLRNLCVIT